MQRFIKGLYSKAGLDASIIYTILSRLTQSVGGILTLILIAIFLDKNEQGYFYTFASIISIQIFFELGLTGIITQYVAHEVSHLNNETDTERKEYHRSRLASIVRMGILWILFISVVLFFVFLFTGYFFFMKYNNGLHVAWQTPWLVLSVSASLLIIINLVFAILEGLGKIKEVARLRLFQHVLTLIFIVAFFIMDFKLLANGAALLLSAIVTAVALIATGELNEIKILWLQVTSHKVDYKTEVLPFQSRLALGNMSGYLIYQIINPVLFATQGAVIAGQMGATQTFLNGILVLSLSWFSTKVALFSTMVARKQYNMLKDYYEKNLFISVAVCTIGILFFIIIVAFLRQIFPAMGNRFLTVIPVIFLGLTHIASVIGNAQAYYLRSFKKEPFFIPSIVIGILSGVATVVCGYFYGITEITITFFIINGLIGFAWGCIIFRTKAFEWTNTKPRF